MSANNWFIFGGRARQLTKETKLRLYFMSAGPWPREEFCEKGRVLAGGLSEEVAMSIQSLFEKEAEQDQELRKSINSIRARNAEERRIAINLILGRTV